MSEEEIIRKLKGYLNGETIFDTELDYTIRHLLDLYNKEKKERNRLQEENKALKEQIHYLEATNNKDILKHWEKK